MPSIEQQLEELKELSKMEFLDDAARREIEKAIEVVDRIDELQVNNPSFDKLPI